MNHATSRVDAFGDSLPALALSRCGTHRFWHPPQEDGLPYRLESVAFSPDSRRVVSAGGRTARVWDVEDGRERAVLSGHVGYVMTVHYVSAGCIATAGSDGTVRLWDAETGAELRRWKLACEFMRRMALSPDGRTLLVGTDRPNGFAIIDLGTEALLQWIRLENSEGGASALAFSPDGSRVLLLERTLEPWRLCVFDTATWTLQWTARGELEDSFAWAAFSPDGRSVSCNHTGARWASLVSTYDVATGVLLKQERDRGGVPVPLADGRHARILDSRLVLFRGDTEERAVHIPSITFCPSWEPVVSPDGRWASFVHGPATVLLIDLGAGAVRPGRHAHHDWILQATFSHDGGHLLTYSQDGTVRRWDCGSGREVDRRVLEETDYRFVHLRGGRVLVGTQRRDMFIQDVLAGTEVRVEGSFSPYSAVWSEDRTLLAQEAFDGEADEYGEHKIQVNDARTGKQVRSVVLGRAPEDLIALSRRFVVTCQSREVRPPGPNPLRFWDLERGVLGFEIPVPKGCRVKGLSPDEAWLVLEEEHKAFVLVNLACPERHVRLESRARLTAIALSEEGRLVATGDAQGEVRVWGTDGVLLAALEGHRALVYALAFSSDGALLASTGADTTALIWPRSAWEAEGR